MQALSISPHIFAHNAKWGYYYYCFKACIQQQCRHGLAKHADDHCSGRRQRQLTNVPGGGSIQVRCTSLLKLDHDQLVGVVPYSLTKRPDSSRLNWPQLILKCSESYDWMENWPNHSQSSWIASLEWWHQVFGVTSLTTRLTRPDPTRQNSFVIPEYLFSVLPSISTSFISTPYRLMIVNDSKYETWAQTFLYEF